MFLLNIVVYCDCSWLLLCVKMTDKKRNYNHVDLNLVESYLRHNKYPDDVSNKGEKANFRRACKKFSIVDGQFKFDGNRLVITDEILYIIYTKV